MPQKFDFTREGAQGSRKRWAGRQGLKVYAGRLADGSLHPAIEAADEEIAAMTIRADRERHARKRRELAEL